MKGVFYLVKYFLLFVTFTILAIFLFDYITEKTFEIKTGLKKVYSYDDYYYFIGLCKNNSCKPIIQDAVCFYNVERGSVLGISNIIDELENSIKFTKKVQYTIYNYNTKELKLLDKNYFYYIAKGNYPDTYKKLSSLDKEDVLCTSYHYNRYNKGNKY